MVHTASSTVVVCSRVRLGSVVHTASTVVEHSRVRLGGVVISCQGDGEWDIMKGKGPECVGFSLGNPKYVE